MSKPSWAYIVAPIVAWLIAQAIKTLFDALNNRGKTNYRMLFKSGSMPSSHTATMLALLTVVGVRDGAQSPLFGAVAVVAAVIMYDAVHVRRAVGEQGEVLQKLAKGEQFYIAKGHRLTDVTVGAAVGLVTAVVVLQIL